MYFIVHAAFVRIKLMMINRVFSISQKYIFNVHLTEAYLIQLNPYTSVA